MLTDAGQYALRFGDVALDYHPPTKAHTMTTEKTDASHLQGFKVNPDVEVYLAESLSLARVSAMQRCLLAA